MQVHLAQMDLPGGGGMDGMDGSGDMMMRSQNGRGSEQGGGEGELGMDGEEGEELNWGGKYSINPLVPGAEDFSTSLRPDEMREDPPKRPFYWWFRCRSAQVSAGPPQRPGGSAVRVARCSPRGPPLPSPPPPSPS